MVHFKVRSSFAGIGILFFLFVSGFESAAWAVLVTGEPYRQPAPAEA